MGLEGIGLSQMPQTETNAVCCLVSVESEEAKVPEMEDGKGGGIKGGCGSKGTNPTAKATVF